MNGSFTVGEKINYISGGNLVSYGFVTYADTSSVTIQHVYGSFSAGNSLVGYDSGATATVISTTLLQQLISDIEYPYWAAVNAYEYEQELNQKKKNILLVDNQLKSSVENEMQRVMA
jgi:hypothetical protein